MTDEGQTSLGFKLKVILGRTWQHLYCNNGLNQATETLWPCIKIIVHVFLRHHAQWLSLSHYKQFCHRSRFKEGSVVHDIRFLRTWSCHGSWAEGVMEKYNDSCVCVCICQPKISLYIFRLSAIITLLLMKLSNECWINTIHWPCTSSCWV